MVNRSAEMLNAFLVWRLRLSPGICGLSRIELLNQSRTGKPRFFWCLFELAVRKTFHLGVCELQIPDTSERSSNENARGCLARSAKLASKSTQIPARAFHARKGLSGTYRNIEGTIHRATTATANRIPQGCGRPFAAR